MRLNLIGLFLMACALLGGCSGGGGTSPTANASIQSPAQGMMVPGISRQTASRVLIKAALAATPVEPQNGWWWNPAEGGSGYAIERQGNQMFAAFFMYEISGASTWYVSTLTLQSNGSFTGPMWRYSNGQTLLGTYRFPNGPTVPANATMTFDTATTGTLVIQPADGSLARTIPIERFGFSTPTAFAASKGSLENGWWWNEAEGGRGYFIEVQGSTAFVGSFMYDGNGQPVWYVSTTTLNGSQSLSGTLQQYANGQSLTGSYKIPPVVGNPGTMSFNFLTNNTANMVLPSGATVALKRFKFTTASLSCIAPDVPDSAGTACVATTMSQVATSLATLDQRVRQGQISDEEFTIQLQQILAAVDSSPDGAKNLASYLNTAVVGGSGAIKHQSAARMKATKTVKERLAEIQASPTYQMLDTFITSVASNLLLSDPASLLLDLAKPEVFISLASIQVRTHVYDAAFSGQIDASTAADLAGKIGKNPFDAERDLLAAKGQAIPAWLEPANNVCLRDCIPAGSNGVYSSPVTGSVYETGGGCVWQDQLSGTVKVLVSGSGTLADPYAGDFDVSGTILVTLISGTNCQPGGPVPITDFLGAVSGTTGRLSASGGGTAGTGTFSATLSNASVSSSAITGDFSLDLGAYSPILQTITLSKQ